MKKRNRQLLIFVAIAIALYYLYNYFKSSNKEVSVEANEMSQGAGVMTRPTTTQNVVVGTDNFGNPVSYVASSSVSGRPVTSVR